MYEYISQGEEIHQGRAQIGILRGGSPLQWQGSFQGGSDHVL
jgi:hypothetical protein